MSVLTKTHKAEINRALSMREYAKTELSKMTGDILSVSDEKIIIAAWGPRSTTRRTRGMSIKPYPPEVTASRALWQDWLSRPVDKPTIVIAKKKARARIDAALSHIDSPQDESNTPSITQDEIEKMMQERAKLRSEKRFEEADKIRDYLLSQGVTVADVKAAKA